LKKYLVLTVTAGEGHNSIARALSTELSKNPENKILQVDLFKRFASISKVKLIDSGYTMVCKFIPEIYNMVFRSLQKRKPEKRDHSIAQEVVKKETKKLLKHIEDENPDVIICTHFFPAIILTNLRKEKKIDPNIKVVSILFDYTVHPFFECAIGVDYMITPDKTLHPLLIKKGYKSEQLLDYGLPVNTVFSNRIEKSNAREELGLNQDLFTVMIMLGGGGFGGTEKLVKKLLKCKTPIQILVVNGKDKESKKRIDKLISKEGIIHTVHNYGYINFVNKLMNASDLFTGKSGGVSVNESLNANLPMALTERLVAQEYDNMLYLTRNNACIKLTSKYTLLNAVEDLSKNTEILEELRKNIAKIKKPDATERISKFCEHLALTNKKIKDANIS
jgi:processive 1,2-diacylglycerol beta-glucosyltransferase